MTSKTRIKWLKNLAFEAEVNGFKFTLDVEKESGGDNLGPRPKPLILAAMSTCSAMDVVSILKKMRIEDYKLDVEVEADLAQEHPKAYQFIRMNFILTGENLPADKVINAVELSITKYCAVYAMLKEAAQIKTRITINNQDVWND